MWSLVGAYIVHFRLHGQSSGYIQTTNISVRQGLSKVARVTNSKKSKCPSHLKGGSNVQTFTRDILVDVLLAMKMEAIHNAS